MGRTAVLPPLSTMGRCVSDDHPGGGQGKGGMTDRRTTLAHRCGFDPSFSVVLPITAQTRPACSQVDAALGFASVRTRPVGQDRYVETCPWLVAGCGKAAERAGLIITIQVKTLPCV